MAQTKAVGLITGVDGGAAKGAVILGITDGTEKGAAARALDRTVVGSMRRH